MSGRRPLSRRLRRRRAQVSHQASRPKRPPILSSAPPTSLPSSTSRRVVHVLGPLLPFFSAPFLGFGSRAGPSKTRPTSRSSPLGGVDLRDPPPAPPARAAASVPIWKAHDPRSRLFRGHGGRSMCPLDEGEIRANPVGHGGVSVKPPCHLERGRAFGGGAGVVGRRETQGRETSGDSAAAQTRKGKKKRYAAKFYSRRRGGALLLVQSYQLCRRRRVRGGLTPRFSILRPWSTRSRPAGAGRRQSQSCTPSSRGPP